MLEGWKVGQLGQGDARSNLPTFQPFQLGNPHQRDDGARLLVSPLHVRIQVRAACDVHPFRTRVGLHRQRLLERLWLQVLEGREPEHQRRRPAVTPTAFSRPLDRKSTRLNSSHSQISYAVFCLKKKKHSRVTPP